MQSSFRSGLRASLALSVGYFPVGVSFGVAAQQAGLSALDALALSALVFAGTAQFLILSLFIAGTPAVVVVLSALLTNLRHLFYAPAVLERAGPKASIPTAWGWTFLLTDGTFALSVTHLARGAPFSERWMWGLSIPPYVSWVSGTALGVALGGAVSAWPALEAGLGFLMPSLFIAMLLAMLARPQLPVIGVTLVATAGLTFLVSATVGVLGGMVIGALAGTVRKPGGAAS